MSPLAAATPDRPEPHPWLVWQLIDSAFPSGGFAHSGGLEAAQQAGEIRDEPSLRGFLLAAMDGVATLSLPFAMAAHDEPQGFATLDDACDACLTSHVANLASRRQGQALLRSAAEIFDVAPLRELEFAARTLPRHHAPVFGVIALHLSLPRCQAAEMFLFMTLRNLLSSAVRLNLVGPIHAQRLQQEITPAAQALAIENLERPVTAAAQTAPLLDLLQATQDRLYSRLFQS